MMIPERINARHDFRHQSTPAVAISIQIKEARYTLESGKRVGLAFFLALPCLTFCAKNANFGYSLKSLQRLPIDQSRAMQEIDDRGYKKLFSNKEIFRSYSIMENAVGLHR
jgi:hypothetical protein